jgi:polysaccharide transporter, PST family
MTLIKTSILTVISTIIKVIVGFIINKVVSVYAGPSGLAIIGQLQNFTSIVTIFSNGATEQGIIKYTAEFKDLDKRKRLFSTSILLSLICSSIISIILFSFSDYLSKLILKNVAYSSVFIIFGLTIFLFALNSILLSILNGQKEIKKYILVNISSSLFSLILTSILVVQLNLIGALYALVINQSIVFFITLLFILKSDWFKLDYFNQGIDKDSFLKLSKFSIMAIVSVLTMNISHLIVRNYIGENIGWDAAGYWQGIWYVSTIYLMIITTSLSIYYLPRLSELEDENEIRQEIYYGYKIIIPIVTIMAISVYLLKEYIVIIVFTDSFTPMLELFKWMLIADVIKIASWLLSFLMLAKAMTKIFLFTQIIFSISFVLFAVFFIKIFGLIGITYALSLNYSLYFITMIFIFRKILWK